MNLNSWINCRTKSSSDLSFQISDKPRFLQCFPSPAVILRWMFPTALFLVLESAAPCATIIV